ncbi:MAG: Sec-independent protein translocase protein TatB [Sphingomonadaceae bacterium]|nr:Sec-independent protein translocase protein TatB [Sphingomonadaceae bacterium]
MFDIGATELLVIVIVAVIVIGPKDMPLAMRTAGRWIGKIRRMSAHFRSGIDTMIREAEMEEMERNWRERNAKIMAEHPAGEMEPLANPNVPPPASAEAALGTPPGEANAPGEGRDASEDAPGKV